MEIDIRVKGTLVKNARLLIVNIKNAGKASIHEIDYFEPLIFEFDTKVLQASVLETTPPTLVNPSDLPAFLTLTPQSVQFPKFPLNPNDSIQISILLEGKGTIEVRGRLDQGTIVELEPEKLEDTFNTLYGKRAPVVPALVATMAAIAILYFIAASLATGVLVVIVAVGAVGAVAGIVTAARIWTTRR